MKIAVIGAGAMGSLYGGYLSRAGYEVYLVDIWQEHIDKINREGLVIVESYEEIRAKPIGITNSRNLEPVDIVIIFVKSINTTSALRDNLRVIGENTIVLSLQNGYGNGEDIGEYIKKQNIVIGTTSHGATMLEPGKILHAGIGETHIGSLMRGTNESILKVEETLEKAGFETTISDNVMKLIWSKLFVNVGINALTAILEIKNGKLLEFDETIQLMKGAVLEAVQVANRLGLDFDEREVIKNVLNVAKSTYENQSSMLQDIKKGRKTEIDKINGAVVKEGENLGIDTPINEVLTRLIAVKESIKNN